MCRPSLITVTHYHELQGRYPRPLRLNPPARQAAARHRRSADGVHVVERALESGADEVWVATDHQGIADSVRAAVTKSVMTSPDHPSGTDRIAEVASQRGWVTTRSWSTCRATNR